MKRLMERVIKREKRRTGGRRITGFIPDALNARISESPESLPKPDIIPTRTPMGMVSAMMKGREERKIFETNMNPSPFPMRRSTRSKNLSMRRTKVKTQNPRKNGKRISRRMYR